MRLGWLFITVAAASLTGCAGTVVLHEDTGAKRTVVRPVPVPAQCCPDEIDRNEAVQIVGNAALRQNVTELHTRDVDFHDNDWHVRMTGLDSCHRWVEIRARVDRRTGALEWYKVKPLRHDDDDDDEHHGHKHGHGDRES
jgi:hypothetical protein